MVGFSSTLALLYAPLALAAVPAPLVTRATLPETFNLYAYGEGIGGVPMFYQNGLAYLGDPRNLNSTVSDFVLFKSEDGTLVGNQNVTSDNPSFSDVTFYVPSSTSSSHEIGFIANSTAGSDVSTSGFTFYGGVCLHVEDDTLATEWFASPTETDGVWALRWNETGDGIVSVSLKTKAPTTQPLVPLEERRI